MKPIRLPLVSSLAAALFVGQPVISMLLPLTVQAAEAATVKADATTRVVAAADAFLATLDDANRAKAVFAADDEEQRRRWSNLPTGIYKRNGLRYGDLTPAQLDAANAVLKAALSESGYRKTMEIVESDEVLKQSGQPNGIKFGRDEFYISFVGKPSPTDRWIIQFGGHHLALNISVIGRENILTPSHTAAQPAIYTVNGKTVRPLGGETDASFALIGALDEAQRKEAILGARFRDLVLPPGQEGKTVMPEGVKVSTFNAAQKALLLKVANEWVGMVNAAAAAKKLDEIKARLDETYFAWSGPITPGSAAYFRIHGPTVWIEFAPQQLGGDPLKHIHTIYRDPTDEYGAKFLKGAK
jgi:hypothetical protein